MNLKEHYRKLYSESIDKISSDKYEIDNLIDSTLDQRFGITLLIRPSDQVKNNIQELLNKLKIVEPKQYYYPNSDIHITTMSIISCYEGFDIEKIEISKYIEIIKKCLPFNQNLKIQFKGLTASNSCVMLQGFMNNDFLNEVRNKLRIEFKNSTLEQSLDKRYPIQTAHSTIVRFRKQFENKGKFLKIIENYSDYDFGSFDVKTMELVYNDWYQREKFVKKLYEFEL